MHTSVHQERWLSAQTTMPDGVPLARVLLWAALLLERKRVCIDLT